MRYSLTIIIIALTVIFLVTPTGFVQESTIQNEATIEIEAATNRIRWDGDIIRSWEADGNVSIRYIKDDKSFECTAEKAIFTREGNEKPFSDKLVIDGSISADFNNMAIETGHLELITDEDDYSIECKSDTVLKSGDYVIKTDRVIFDAADGLGEFPDGVEFEFRLIDLETGVPVTEEPQIAQTVFGQCLRIDTSGGILTAPGMTLDYEINSESQFCPCFLTMHDGGKLIPLDSYGMDDTVFSFGKIRFDIRKNFLEASEGTKLQNGPCSIESNDVTLDFVEHRLEMNGDVVLSREMVEFKTGLITVTWDDEGRISLSATENPRMRINFPEESADEMMDNL